jgi:inosine/xanthosine triphosphatase
MIRVVVASVNPVKVNAVNEAFVSIFKESIEIFSIEVASGVCDQPLTDAETYLGAANRAKEAKNKLQEADYWVGIEGGVDSFGGDFFHAFGWVYIMGREMEGFSRSASFPLTLEISQLILQGKELGVITDELFGLHQSKQKGGMIGVLTGGAVDRRALYVQPIQFALIPFINK